jgi:hypothetical protein
MGFLDGLFIYEIALLFAGIILFLALIFILVYFVIITKTIKNTKFLAPLFVISILMIGFPSFSAIKIGKDYVEVEKKKNEVADNPSDSGAREDLAQALNRIEKRPISNPERLLNLAEARIAIGDTTKALTHVRTVLKDKPNSMEALKLRRELTKQ